MRVVFDIGHCPFPGDPGAVNEDLNIREHDWCYTFANACRFFALSHKLFDPAIVLRKSGITEISARINRLEPDFVVSFHMNGFKDPKATGTETLFYHVDANGRMAAQVINDSMVDAVGLKNRGIKPSTLPQLWMVDAPIVLIEPGFLTNNNDMITISNNYGKLIAAIVMSIPKIIDLI